MKKINFIGIIIIILLCGTREASTGDSSSITAIIENALSEEFYQFPGSAAQFKKSSIWMGADCIYWYDDTGSLTWISFPEHKMIMGLRGDYRRGVVISNLDYYGAEIDSSGSVMLREVDLRMVRLQWKKRIKLVAWKRILSRFQKSSAGLKNVLSHYRRQTEMEESFSLEKFPLDFDNPLLNMPRAKLEYFIDPYGNRLEVDSRFRIIEPEIIQELRVKRRQTELWFLRDYMYDFPSIPFILIVIILLIRNTVRFSKQKGKSKRDYRLFAFSICKTLCKSLLIIFLILVYIIIRIRLLSYPLPPF